MSTSAAVPLEQATLEELMERAAAWGLDAAAKAGASAGLARALAAGPGGAAAAIPLMEHGWHLGDLEAAARLLAAAVDRAATAVMATGGRGPEGGRRLRAVR